MERAYPNPNPNPNPNPIQVNQKYALEHQMIVVDCLEDPDETLTRTPTLA